IIGEVVALRSKIEWMELADKLQLECHSRNSGTFERAFSRTSGRHPSLPAKSATFFSSSKTFNIRIRSKFEVHSHTFSSWRKKPTDVRSLRCRPETTARLLREPHPCSNCRARLLCQRRLRRRKSKRFRSTPLTCASKVQTTTKRRHMRSVWRRTRSTMRLFRPTTIRLSYLDRARWP